MTWGEAIDGSAKRLELAAMIGGAVQYDAVGCGIMARKLRAMASMLDRVVGDGPARTWRLFGFKITISRDG